MCTVQSTQVDICGKMIIEPQGADQCLHTIVGTVNIKMFGVGSFVQSLIVESLENAYEQLPKVGNQWLILREQLLSSSVGYQPLPVSIEYNSKALMFTVHKSP